jgi:hypothetical protein
MWKKIGRIIRENNSIRELALLFAGALASILGGFLIQSPIFDNRTGVLITLIIFLIVYGTGIISKIFHRYYLRRRKSNLKIGILNDMNWDPKNKETSTWTDVSPLEWKKEIEETAKNLGVQIEVTLIDNNDNFDPYTAIFNPYGGVYPESDLKDFITLNKILNYVREDGLFVNVADIPGYWAYNSTLERRLDATPQIYGTYTSSDNRVNFIPARPFELTPLMKELGLRVYNTEAEQFKSIFNWGRFEFERKFKEFIGSEISEFRVHRVAVVEKNVESIIKPKESRFYEKEKVTPFLLVKYGEGRFLISLVFESAEEHKTNKEEIKKTIVKLAIGFIKSKNKKAKEARVWITPLASF